MTPTREPVTLKMGMTLTADLSPAMRDAVIAYKLARNQQLDENEPPWTNDDVLYAALVRGIESLDATTQHLLRRVPA